MNTVFEAIKKVLEDGNTIVLEPKNAGFTIVSVLKKDILDNVVSYSERFIETKQISYIQLESLIIDLNNKCNSSDK